MTRKVVTRAPAREVGAVNAAWLLEQPVEHESHLEKRFIMIALSCPVVTHIVHQPMTMELIYGPNERAKYTPDFKVRFRDGDQIIVEVKPEVFISENKRTLEAAKKQLAGEGTRYAVFTDKQIDANGLAARALLLMRYGRLWLSDDDALECKRLLEDECAGSARVSSLMARGVSESLIWNMVARHQLRVPAGLNINPHETVEINTPLGECHDYFCAWFGST
ncbi:TnsA endonuclease N-terminal domain-containing protein [Polaromonas sp.]|uniref:TnsA endonuclease N-terminal domain-containing protein n=1 Tax=Polaromonas sp. TaxID=1869339 RepID=UPI0032650905